jgi:hypothetical protein
MSVNLIEIVQKNLGYPALQKIDPNTQVVVEDEKTPDEDRFSQAAIPATLTALYKFAQSDSGAAEVLRGDSSTNWADKIFPENRREVFNTITSYSGKSPDILRLKLNEIAAEAVKITKSELHADAAVKDVKLFFNNQRNNILLYLPAALNMGGLLNDDTLDDNTNKMEGPISSLMHSIGSAFSTSVTNEEVKNK